MQNLKLVKEYLSSPSWKLLGINLEKYKNNCVTLSFIVKPEFLQSYEQLQGGLLFTLLDAAGVSSVGPVVYPKKLLTLEAKINYIRSVTEGHKVFGEGEVVHLGRTTAVTNLKAYDDKNQLLAIGTATFAIR